MPVEDDCVIVCPTDDDTALREETETDLEQSIHCERKPRCRGKAIKRYLAWLEWLKEY